MAIVWINCHVVLCCFSLPPLLFPSSALPSLSFPCRPPPLLDWLLLDRSLFSLDGSQCDKIGASFSAFQYQADKCRRYVGSCLSNQLLDFAEVSRRDTSFISMLPVPMPAATWAWG